MKSIRVCICNVMLVVLVDALVFGLLISVMGALQSTYYYWEVLLHFGTIRQFRCMAKPLTIKIYLCVMCKGAPMMCDAFQWTFAVYSAPAAVRRLLGCSTSSATMSLLDRLSPFCSEWWFRSNLVRSSVNVRLELEDTSRQMPTKDSLLS